MKTLLTVSFILTASTVLVARSLPEVESETMGPTQTTSQVFEGHDEAINSQSDAEDVAKE